MRLILILTASLVMAGCGSDTGSGSSDRTSVVASFYPLAYAAEEIGGDSVEVANLTPPGVEPHDIELSVRDVERIRSADVVLYLGSGFQPAVERAAEDADGETVDLLEERLKLREGDPHVWLDPTRYELIAGRVGDVLDRPATAFRVRLEQLHADFDRGLADCDRREIVTSHDAFGYLAERYGLEQIAITGVSPEAEPTPRALERVIEEIRQSGATTVFFETLVSPRIAETVARETGAATAVLNPLEGLTENEVAHGESYFSIMRANLETLRKALGCR